MNEPKPSGGVGDRLNDAINWVQQRSRNEWIMFGVGVVVGILIG